MKTKTIIAACMLGVLSSCTSSTNDKTKTGESDSLSVSENVADNSISVKKIEVSDSLVQGEHRMLANYRVDYPEKGEGNLVNSIQEWINETLGGKYDGTLSNPEEMIRFYVKQSITPEQPKFEWNSDQIVQIKKGYETDKFVTFTQTTYSYMGGAHGMTFTGGNTFRKSDGRKFGWDMFRSDLDYTELFKEALKRQYFKVKTNEELENSLMLQIPGYLPKPVSDPFFTKEGVTFIYQQYEIACYAAGAPTFTIPYSKIDKYMTVTAKNLLK